MLLAVTACSAGPAASDTTRPSGNPISPRATADSASEAVKPAYPIANGKAEGVTTYPLDIKSPYGSATIPKRPERMAVFAGVQDLEAVLSLGIIPVISEEVSFPWQRDAGGDKIAEQIDVWSAGGLQFEKILAAKPDVIIAISYRNIERDYARLSSIAPVVTAETNVARNSWEVRWEDVLARVGEVLDMPGAAADITERTVKMLADTGKRHPQWKGKSVTFAINRGPGTGIGVANYSGSAVEKIASTLGCAPQPKAAELAKSEGNVSPENYSYLAAMSFS